MPARTEPTYLEAALIVALAAVAAYVSSLANGFAFDDLIVIRDNPEIRSWARAIRYFAVPVYPGDLYRPLPMLTYALNFAFSGVAPLPYHAVNVLLHTGASVLAFAVLGRLITRRSALLAALIFAVHPLHVEAVANVVGRAELLAACGVLGAVYLALSTEIDRRPKLVAGIFICSLLGMLSKESALVVLILIPLALWQALGSKMRKRLWMMLPAGGAALAYLVLRTMALGKLFGGSAAIPFIDNPLAALPAIDRMVAALSVLGRYLLLSVVPFPLSADYSYPQFLPGGAPIDLLYAALVVSLMAVAVRGLFLRDLRGLGVLWFFGAFAVTANLLIPIGTVMAERLAYLPVLGSCIFLVTLLDRALPRYSALMIKGLAVIFALQCAIHSKVWKSNQTLHEYQLRASPLSAKTQLNYSMVMRDQGDLDSAAVHARQALELYPQYPHAAWALAELYVRKGIASGARDWYARALAIDPKHKESYAGLGRLAILEGRFDEAEAQFEKSLALDHGYFDAQVGLFAVYVNRGELERAKNIGEHLRGWNPENEDFRRVDAVLRRMVEGER